MTNPPIRAADHLVDIITKQGTDYIFGVPGESFLPVLDALYQHDDIQFITCRQEGGAAMAADAHAKLTGKVGLCMVTRGPGATNASAGVHVAFQDSTPMILLIGQVARSMQDREAFQEIDYRRMFGQMAKWVAQIDDPSRIQEYVCRAYRTALSGRQGPVVLALPEDMLYENIIPPNPPALITAPSYVPAKAEITAMQEAIQQASRPLIIAGGSGWSATAIQTLQKLAEKQHIPVAVSLRCQGLFHNEHPCYAGHCGVGGTPYLSEAIKNADLLIVIGARLGEMTTVGYTTINAPVPHQKLIHIYPQPEELGRVYQPEIALVADYESFCTEAAIWQKMTKSTAQAFQQKLHQQYLLFSDPKIVSKDPLAPFFAHLNQTLPENAILCNGAGNYAGWLHRFYRYRAKGSQLAPTSGSMGYGLPAAIAAAISAPDREVFAIAGDGCFMMTMQELATAQHFNLNLTVIIVNNNRLGTIRAHQEREYPERLSNTDLSNPDFGKLAESFGAKAYLVYSLAEFCTVIAQSRIDNGINVIEIRQDPNLIAVGKWLK